ncbi:EngC GTPase [Legionella quinlivanii]|uniref:Small ribosomal subunit biogenesis GTPase RsgA n=1 Tax=Legionella quinlivanii TaxID=45073 RepID=A0A0W0XTE4_9GAMM|nr:ribosome small subunit-dependent GTPase A [Legionella quinlivanii]KTD48097.1 EngC GTPase [Legionella quinlivanii]SEG39825.1 ribosome biogenesis GTPase [Legionella quinlivanii DSM 21216]STY09936.1 EngC GTPase [Legionella quinlivanii]
MSKRRINKQQAARIQKIQADFLEATHPLNDLNHQGLVVTRYGKHAEVETEKGEIIHCLIRPNIDSLVAGDQVIWQVQGETQGVIVSRFPRKVVLEKQDKRGSKPIAANISQLIIVVAPKPAITWSLLDSYLVITEHLGLNPILLLNKTDLECAELKAAFVYYESLGYPVLFLSNTEPDSFSSLETHLTNQISVFVGQSGVGKSSIIAQILPHESIQTAEISLSSELGCHTTTNSRFYHLPKGGALIDSPGVREFGLWEMPRQEIIYGFREIRNLTADCRFRNCDHQQSPGCAIIQAVSDGNISTKRYDSFLKILMQYGVDL